MQGSSVISASLTSNSGGTSSRRRLYNLHDQFPIHGDRLAVLDNHDEAADYVSSFFPLGTNAAQRLVMNASHQNESESCSLHDAFSKALYSVRMTARGLRHQALHPLRPILEILPLHQPIVREHAKHRSLITVQHTSNGIFPQISAPNTTGLPSNSPGAFVSAKNPPAPVIITATPAASNVLMGALMASITVLQNATDSILVRALLHLNLMLFSNVNVNALVTSGFSGVNECCDHAIGGYFQHLRRRGKGGLSVHSSASHS